ncbi:MAG: beta-glucosidase [Bacilli bacterium]
MKIEDKVKLLSGKDVWHTADVPGVPSIMLADGPHGIRKQVDSEDNIGVRGTLKATLYPAAATVACTFNSDLAYRMGKMIGAEARHLDVQVVLGPGINIKRNPLCGRNFEYYSEDPHLAGTLGYQWIRGAQSNHVGTSLKHFAANSQETLRLWSDSVIDERALREIYLKNFQIALKAEPSTVMCCYNKVNGTYGSENKYLLTDILRNEWGYKGLVVSDWGAVSNHVKAVLAGRDLEMPSSHGYGTKKILEGLKKGEITEADIDRSAQRVIALVNEYKDNEVLDFDRAEAEKTAREIATEGIVLLKNEGVLPLKPEEKVAIVGGFAERPRTQGGGSSHINPHRIETVLGEIPAYTENYRYFQGYNLDNDEYNEELAEEVLGNIAAFDKVIVMTGLPEWYETEGEDRRDMGLPASHLRLIEEILKKNPNVIVTLYIGAPVEMPFAERVKGILNLNLLGEASGKPVLDILYGKVSPSGRLATTFPLKLEDDSSTSNFGNTNNAVWYVESIFVGYRYYTTFKKKVLYPFGYGLSYSEFAYSDLEVDAGEITEEGKIAVKCKVKNVGQVPAKEVVQLYVENHRGTLYKPLRELRRYTKVELNPGEEKEVSFTLRYEDFSYYDVNLKEFYVDKGIYKIQICKHADAVILEKAVEKKTDKPGYKWTGKKVYNLTDEEFAEVYGKPLPPRNVKRRRPYTMDDSVNFIQGALVGRIMKRMIRKHINKLTADPKEREALFRHATTVPLRTLATMSGGVFTLEKMEGIVDILNFKIIRGLKKL